MTPTCERCGGPLGTDSRRTTTRRCRPCWLLEVAERKQAGDPAWTWLRPKAPTQAEIRERAAAIRAGWSKRERKARLVRHDYIPWTVPEITGLDSVDVDGE
jgi:hypothetical protein